MFRPGIWLLSLVLVACSSIQMDGAYPADLAGDKTIIMKAEGPGCISRPEVGFSFCRKPVGEALAADRLDFYAPSSNMDCDPCTVVYVKDLSGADVASLSFGKEGGVRSLVWSDLIKESEFKRVHEGPYNIVLRHRFENSYGNPQVMVQRGMIYLLVYFPVEQAAENPRNYRPLNQTPDSNVWAFTRSEGEYLFKWSTAGRAYVGSNR